MVFVASSGDSHTHYSLGMTGLEKWNVMVLLSPIHVIQHCSFNPGHLSQGWMNTPLAPIFSLGMSIGDVQGLLAFTSGS